MAKWGVVDIPRAWSMLRDRFTEHWADQEQWEGRKYEDIVLDKALLKERRYGTHLLASALGLAPVKASDEEAG